MPQRKIEIKAIYTSPGHNYIGNKRPEVGSHPTHENESVDLAAGKGIVGDRFFDKSKKAHVTFFADEVFDELCESMAVAGRSTAVFRRNIVTRGLDLKSLIGQTFHIDGIEFYGVEHCAPCEWMDVAFAKGARKALRGRGGLRAKVLSSGSLHTGESEFSSEVPADTDMAGPLPRLRLPS